MVNMAIATGDEKYLRQREYFRMNCCIPLSFSLVKTNKPELVFLKGTHHGLIRDLSGGGMRMAAEFEMAEEDAIRFMFHLDQEFFELTGGIRHQIHAPDSYPPYLHGIMFMGLPMHKREKIISYLHRCQLMSLKLQGQPSRYYQPAARTSMVIAV